jgi:hypothetical protein
LVENGEKNDGLSTFKEFHTVNNRTYLPNMSDGVADVQHLLVEQVLLRKVTVIIRPRRTAVGFNAVRINVFNHNVLVANKLVVMCATYALR